jgi:tRNA A37 methylthiotransferase MiaB
VISSSRDRLAITMTRFSITTLGCKVNQYDGCALATMLSRSGMSPAEAGQKPDLVVVNTCCVTVEAMRKSRQAIRRAVREARPTAVLVVGCYSDYDGDRIRTLLGNLTLPPDRIFVAGHHSDLREQLAEVVSALSAKEPSAPQAFWGKDDVQTGPQGGMRDG